MVTFRDFLLIDDDTVTEGKSRYAEFKKHVELERNNPKPLTPAARKKRKQADLAAEEDHEREVANRLQRDEESK